MNCSKVEEKLNYDVWMQNTCHKVIALIFKRPPSWWCWLRLIKSMFKKSYCCNGQLQLNTIDHFVEEYFNQSNIHTTQSITVGGWVAEYIYTRTTPRFYSIWMTCTIPKSWPSVTIMTISTMLSFIVLYNAVLWFRFCNMPLCPILCSGHFIEDRTILHWSTTNKSFRCYCSPYYQ